MRKYIIILTILICPALTKAQKRSILKDSTPQNLISKNEIGLNLSPVINFLQAGRYHQQEKRFAISYKRILNEKSALRSSIGTDYNNYTWINNSMGNGGINYNYYNMKSNSPFLRLGYERHFGQGKLTFFYGVDLIIGYYRNRIYSGTTESVYNSTSSSYEYIYTQKMAREDGFNIGLSPFFGTKYSFSKHFAVSAQTSFDFTHQSGRNQGVRTNTFNFKRGPGFFTDISVIYKF